MATRKEIEQEIKATKTGLKEIEQMHQHLKHLNSKTTKFKITMELEVADIGNVPVDESSLNAAMIKAAKSISDGKMIQVLNSHTSQLTFPNDLKIKS